jgi:hypothetical protein
LRRPISLLRLLLRRSRRLVRLLGRLFRLLDLLLSLFLTRGRLLLLLLFSHCESGKRKR